MRSLPIRDIFEPDEPEPSPEVLRARRLAAQLAAQERRYDLARSSPGRAGRPRLDDLYSRARQQRRVSDNGGYQFLSRLGYPPGIEPDIAWMRSMPTGSSALRLDSVILWLAEDPFCLHSGYLRQTAMRLLRRFEFTPRQAEELRDVILAVLTRGKRQDFSELVRLARSVNSERLREGLQALIASADEGTVERATLMLASCERAA